MANLPPLFKRSAGLDVHQKSVVACILIENEQGIVSEQIKEFTTYPHELQKLADWLMAEKVEITVMESTGCYWLRHEAVNESCLHRKGGDHLCHQVNLGA